MKKVFKIDVDCANCARKVEDAMKKVDGVEDVKVNFMTQKMTLTADDARFDAVAKACAEAGKRVEKDFEIFF